MAAIRLPFANTEPQSKHRETVFSHHFTSKQNFFFGFCCWQHSAKPFEKPFENVRTYWEDHTFSKYFLCTRRFRNLKFKKSRRPKIKKSENQNSKTYLLDSKFEIFQMLRINNKECLTIHLCIRACSHTYRPLEGN